MHGQNRIKSEYLYLYGRPEEDFEQHVETCIISIFNIINTRFYQQNIG